MAPMLIQMALAGYYYGLPMRWGVLAGRIVFITTSSVTRIIQIPSSVSAMGMGRIMSITIPYTAIEVVAQVSRYVQAHLVGKCRIISFIVTVTIVSTMMV